MDVPSVVRVLPRELRLRRCVQRRLLALRLLLKVRSCVRVCVCVFERFVYCITLIKSISHTHHAHTYTHTRARAGDDELANGTLATTKTRVITIFKQHREPVSMGGGGSAVDDGS